MIHDEKTLCSPQKLILMIFELEKMEIKKKETNVTSKSKTSKRKKPEAKQIGKKRNKKGTTHGKNGLVHLHLFCFLDLLLCFAFIAHVVLLFSR